MYTATVRVAERFEATGDGVAAGTSAAAVHDHRGVPVGEEPGRQAIDLPWRDVDGAGKVRVAVVADAQRLHEGRAVAVGRSGGAGLLG